MTILSYWLNVSEKSCPYPARKEKIYKSTDVHLLKWYSGTVNKLLQTNNNNNNNNNYNNWGGGGN